MDLLAKIDAERRGKSFVEPPFWASDPLRAPFLASFTAEQESIENDFEGYVGGAYKSNGVVFGCIDRRQQVFSQGRFQWQQFTNGKPGDFFGSPELSLLEEPWPNGTTGELLAHMEYDASLAGNFYCTTVDDAGRTGRRAVGPGRRVARMRPDRTTLIIDAPSGNPYGVDARVVAYEYRARPNGGVSNEPLLLLPNEVCHYSPKPDPVARFRGMSWLTPIISEIMADKGATLHKRRFFDNGATPNMAIKFDAATTPERFKKFVAEFNDAHRGADRAYKTLFLAGGADITPLSVDFKQLDFKVTQGAGETRMAVAAGVPAVILGISEGLQGSSLNSGNFAAARRLFVHTTIQDLWNKAAPSLQVLLSRPLSAPRATLQVDGRFVPFLREDERDRAEIQAQEAQTIRTLIDAGYEADSIVAAIAAHDWRLLVHSGLFSVQLQAPGLPTLGMNGNGSARGLEAASPR